MMVQLLSFVAMSSLWRLQYKNLFEDKTVMQNKILRNNIFVTLQVLTFIWENFTLRSTILHYFSFDGIHSEKTLMSFF